jgi:hypothetical protein
MNFGDNNFAVQLFGDPRPRPTLPGILNRAWHEQNKRGYF